jgi:glycogen debranching enzyme
VKALGDSRLTPARLYEAAYRWDAATPAVTLEAADVAELVIEELEGASLPDSQYPPFDEVVDARRDDFVGYLDVIAPFRSDQTPGVAHAAYVNWATTVFPSGFLRRNTVLMSKHWMDKAWSWDHCFNALASSRHSADAWDQYWVMFDHQSEAGQLPDSIAHSEVRFNYSKPPIHGLTLGSLLARTPEEPAMADLARLYDTMEAWTHWWRTVMTAPGESLAHYYFGNDSGWDNSTMFDGFHPIQAPDLNAFLVLQMEVLADLATRLGRGDAAARWTNRAERTLEALVDQLWDGERFVARHPKTGETRWSQTLLLTMPIILGRRLHPEITEALTRAIASHLTDHGLATEHPESPDYDPDGYWRGPIWAPSTYLIWQGLRESGQEQLAAEVSERFRAMCERSGFAENFDAVTGAGLRDRAYTWTASVYLLLSEEAEKRG